MWLYRALLSVAAPFVLAGLLWRVLRGRERWGDLAQRLGHGAGQRGAIWIHGASNGELTSARKLITALRAAHPDTPMVITCNTLSGRALAQSWGLAATTVRLAPLDLRWVLSRFTAAWQPRVLVVLENELWPNRLATVSPVIAVAARMSARSAARWARAPRLARAVMGRIDHLAPQDAASGGHFQALGLPGAALGPVYAPKADVEMAPPDPTELADLSASFDRDNTWLAASTHPGEDEIILGAMRHCPPETRLILAPRHPSRGDSIRRMAQDLGLTVAQRSKAEPPRAQVYLVDTLGEMPLWYSLAGVTFVAGSLVPRGGHTPYEPTALGSAVLHGPHVANFSRVYSSLDESRGAIELSDAAAIHAALAALLGPEGASARDAMVARARTCLQGARDSQSDASILHEIGRRL
jgi:3-deoxy-D-manno-octulosonic-acid transferase